MLMTSFMVFPHFFFFTFYWFIKSESLGITSLIAAAAGSETPS